MRTEAGSNRWLNLSVAAAIQMLRSGKHLQVELQPIFRLSDEEQVGFECLSRMTMKPFRMPDDFFRISMEAGMLSTVDLHCFKNCLQASLSMVPNLQCHLNLFPSTLIDIPPRHLLQLMPQQRPTGTYCLELSEQQILGDPTYLLDSIRILREGGLLIAMDDVGFGNSCLESLVLFEPEVVKLARQFVSGVARDLSRMNALKRLLCVLDTLKTEVIAEGIETLEDLEALKSLGILYGQGFYWGRNRPEVMVGEAFHTVEEADTRTRSS